MDAGNREEQYRLGATLPARDLGSPSPTTPRRPLRYHNHDPHHHHYPLPHAHTKHDNGHYYAGTLDRDQEQPLSFFEDQHARHYRSVLAADNPSAAAPTTEPGTLDNSVFESHVVSNRNAAHANAIAGFEPNGFINPDDFYRAHIDGLMASTLSVSRHNQDASIRHNANIPATRHPAIRSGTRPAIRSASTPVEEKQAVGAARPRPAASSSSNSRSGHQPSVKDLKKKFDQNSTQANSTATRKTQPRVPAREKQWSVAPSHASYPDVRSSTAATLPTSSTPTLRTAHRQRAMPDDTASSSTQSFASRIAKPRASVGTHTQASKSMNSLAPASPTGRIPPLPQHRALLFGEIDPAELNAGLAGHGISTGPGRRTSESNIEKITLGRRQRSFSYTDVEPPSPTDWYRNVRGELGNAQDTSANRSQSSHGRSRSDMSFVKPTQPTNAKAGRPKPTIETSAVVSPSRIPVSVRKLSTPSSSSSPNSTRSNSPSTVRRSFAHGKKMNANHNIGAKLPSPTVPPAMKRQHRPDAIMPSTSTRLNAYISAPPPKLSPPLRSSRPRQPVSAATTVSSRIRASERDRSPGKKDARTNGKGNDPATRRRKIQMGPIDYESRREQIKLSYTKSLRESEARTVARRVAQERKKKEEAEAEAIALALASESLNLQEEEEEVKEDGHGEEEEQVEKTDDLEHPIRTPTPDSGDTDGLMTKPLTLRMITSSLAIESPVDSEGPAEELPPLQPTDTGSKHEIPTIASDMAEEVQESPTLGMPGTFPSVERSSDFDEAPPSAVSNTTEFDAEPQTEPPTQETVVLDTNDEVPIPIGIHDNAPLHQQSEYRSPFEVEEEPVVDDGLSIKISLDTSAEPIIISEEPPAPENGDLGTVQAVPVTYQGDDAYEPIQLASISYETKVTILPPGSEFTSPSLEIDNPLSTLSVAQPEASEESNPQGTTPASGNSYPDDSTAPSDIGQGEPSCSLSEMAEFFVGPLIKEKETETPQVFGIGQAVTSLRTDDESGMQLNYDDQDTTDTLYPLDSGTSETHASLTIPRTSGSIKRTSQTTMWTDYSVDSQESGSGYSPAEVDSRIAGPTWHEEFVRAETESRSGSYRYTRNAMTVSDSRDVSPCGTHREPESFESQLQQQQQVPQHQLPEIDTGEAFTECILSRKNSADSCVIPAIPTHSPPLPPDDIYRDMMSSAAPSEYYDETRPNSYLRSEMDDNSLLLTDSLRRDSDYFPPSETTTRSIDQGSLATSEGHPSGSSRLASQQTLVESINVEQASELSAKEKKRLFTRLETVKELVDTEAFFIRDMNIVEEIYKGTAEACPKLDDQTIKLIFRNTDKIVEFHTEFLVALKEGVSSIYTPRTHRQSQKDATGASDGATSSSGASIAASGHLSDEKDRETTLGPIFIRHMESMKQVHETFLKNSDHAAKRLIQIQEDPTVQVWLNECNEVARELTRAWNLDSLLIKPMQRITKYPNLLIQLLHETPQDHPDRPSLEAAKTALENAIEEINKTKKNFELVGQIVSRRRKDSDVKAGFARAFGKRVDRLQAVTNKPVEDVEYMKLHERFGDDYLRLQVVLRDVEFYTRQVTEHVREFLQYLSSMELVMRLQASPYPEIESKWVRFNVSMRDMEKVALEEHLGQVRKQVIEPFESVIKSYSNPSLAMKKRSKRRVDYDKYIQLQKSGKKIDRQLSELVEQYEALNEALKKELPKLSALTEKVGNICLGNFVSIQAQWYSIWKEKVKAVLEDQEVPELSSIITTFHRDFKLQDEQINMIGIVNPAAKSRPSHSTSVDEVSSRFRLRPLDPSPRNRGLSLNSDIAPSLPTPDFMKRHSGQFIASPSLSSLSSPSQFYRDYYNGVNGQARPGPESPKATDFSTASRSLAPSSARPGTGQSHESSGVVRQSIESSSQTRGYPNSAQPSPYQSPESHRYSGLFQSALPMSDAHERQPRPSQVSSRASSRERQPINGYNVLWLAASLFEFNIQTTKHEAGYPYLTYQAGEIFDVIAEKGELWLAKNQDDPKNLVGWLWSKHFAKLADD